MEAVNVCLQSELQPAMFTGYGSSVVFTTQIAMDLIEFQDFVFFLGTLWKLDLDIILSHWTCNMFACGLVDRGKSVSGCINVHIIPS